MSTLLAQWQGPYQVVKRIGKVTYLIDMHDKSKCRRVFHVNMLREYQVHKVVGSNYYAEGVTGESEEEEVYPLWNDDAQEGQPVLGEQLDSGKERQLQELLTEYGLIFQNKPGQTQLAEHKIETNSARHVRLPPYRLPQAYRESVQKVLEDMLRHDIIESSSSEWAAPIVLVKKDGSLPLCVDYQRLNSIL